MRRSWGKSRIIFLGIALTGVIAAGCVLDNQRPIVTDTISTVKTNQPTFTDTEQPTPQNLPENTSTPFSAFPNQTAVTATVQKEVQLPDPQGYTWISVVNGLDRPVGLAAPGDGSGRLFVVEQGGRLRILRNGSLLSTPFLDITDQVGSAGSEQGLLGIAFHPDYLDNGFFYLNYTDLEGNTVIARYKVGTDTDQADPNSQKILLQVKQPFANHNGGSLAFGPDGYLYLGFGDGGSGGDPFGNGQSTQTLLGKILRLDVDNGEPYGIPAGNPLAQGGGLPEIWDWGLRNPWRFTFDRVNGDLYIADVGQNLWEEVNYEPDGTGGGINYGWNYREGAHPYEGEPPSELKLTDPIWEYAHQEGGCSITGGVVYRGADLPDWQGVYLSGDFCTGNIWGLVNPGGNIQSELLFKTDFMISTFGEDDEGEVYLCDYTGSVYRLVRVQ